MPTKQSGIIDGTEGLIFTFSGETINPLAPAADRIHPEDIAHSLSNQCRFTGHTREFYSTAQHCYHVSYLVPEEFALWGLLHDATEAYLADIARPVKYQPEFGDVYIRFEKQLEKAVIERFGLVDPMPKEVKDSDTLMLWAEVRDLMPQDIPIEVEVPDLTIDPWTPAVAEYLFLQRYFALT